MFESPVKSGEFSSFLATLSDVKAIHSFIGCAGWRVE
jgi:hypothetical protein